MTNDVTAQIRMPGELRKQAEALASADRRSLSDWIRLLIEREVTTARLRRQAERQLSQEPA